MTRRTHVMPGNLYPGTFTISSRKLSQLDRDTAQLVNFDDGGLYAPSGPIVVGGLGMQLSTSSTFNGHITTLPGYGGKRPMLEMATTYPTFSAARTVVKTMSLARGSVSALSSPFIAMGAQFTADGNLAWRQDTFGNGNGIDVTLVADDTSLHDGATLTRATLFLRYDRQFSAVPAETLQITRVSATNATSGLFLHSNGTFGSTFYTSGIASRVVAGPDDFYNNGRPVSIVYEPDQNNVVDKATFLTQFRIRTDEYTTLFGIKLEYSVSDQRFE